jgi:hypothetical protein
VIVKDARVVVGFVCFCVNKCLWFFCVRVWFVIVLFCFVLFFPFCSGLFDYGVFAVLF